MDSLEECLVGERVVELGLLYLGEVAGMVESILGRKLRRGGHDIRVHGAELMRQIDVLREAKRHY